MIMIGVKPGTELTQQNVTGVGIQYNIGDIIVICALGTKVKFHLIGPGTEIKPREV